MFKKALLLLIVSVAGYHFCLAQYTDDAKDKSKSDTSRYDSTAVATPPLFDFKQNGVKGMELMLTAGGATFFGELSPFVGVTVKDIFVLGAGVHGSVLIQNKPFTYYGANAFVRIMIAQRFFLHGEYRLLNGIVPGGASALDRKWVSSPIAGVGIMNGSSSWFLIGYAFNTDFQQINPFGSLVYRIGFYF